MIIERLQIDNFRAIGHIEFAPHRRMNVVIGANGAGKTAFLEAIACTIDAAFSEAAELEIRGMTRLVHEADRQVALGRVRTPELGFSRRDFRVGVHETGLQILLWSKGSTSIISAQEGHNHQVRTTGEAAVPKDGAPIALATYFGTARSVSRFSPPPPPAPALPGRWGAWSRAFHANTDFASFSEWFVSRSVAESLVHSRTRNFDHRDPDLQTVREAIRRVIPDCEDVWYQGDEEGIRVQIRGEPEVGLVELSDGYRTMLALAADLAHRMIVGNPHLGLDSEALVLIDEIDQHLHPRWQQTVLASLLYAFPHAQFFVTTHSPTIIATAEAGQLLVLEKGPDGVTASAPTSAYGALPQRVLEDVMGLERARAPAVRAKLEEYFGLIAAGEGEGATALAVRDWLEARFRGQDPVMTRADMEIRRQRRASSRG